LFFDRTAAAARRVLFLERTCWLAVLPVDPALFLFEHVWTEPVPPGHAFFNAPTTRHLGRFRPVFSAAKPPGIRDKKARHRCLDRPAEWSFLEPIWERPAGPKHTRAEQEEG